MARRLLILAMLAIAAAFLGMAFVVTSRGYGMSLSQSVVALLNLSLMFALAAGVIWRWRQ